MYYLTIVSSDEGQSAKKEFESYSEAAEEFNFIRSACSYGLMYLLLIHENGSVMKQYVRVDTSAENEIVYDDSNI